MTTFENLSPEAAAARGKRAAIVWGSVIFGLLGLQLVLCVIGVTMATRNKSAAIESNYYDKALHWDEQKARSAASLALGWRVKLSVGEIAVTGGRQVSVTVVDKNGAVVQDAKVTVGYFHHALPKETHEAELAPAAGGIYQAVLPVDRPGKWEFRLMVTRAEAVYGETILQEVDRAAYRE
jgi:nitrogen fixation protein FixH